MSPGPTLAVDNVKTPISDAITHEINFYARLHKGERPPHWEIDGATADALAAELFAAPCYDLAKKNGLRLDTVIGFVRAGGARLRGVQLRLKPPA